MQSAESVPPTDSNFDPELPLPSTATLYHNTDSDALPFTKNKFDYIHVQGPGHIKEWPKFARETFRVLAPGGYAEYCEISLDFLKSETCPRLPAPWAECSRTKRPLRVDLEEWAAWMKGAGYAVNTFHDSLALDGEPDLKTDLRRFLISRLIAAVTLTTGKAAVTLANTTIASRTSRSV